MIGTFLESLTLCCAELILREKEYSEREQLGLLWDLTLFLYGNLICLPITALGDLLRMCRPHGFPSGFSFVLGEGGGEGNLT